MNARVGDVIVVPGRKLGEVERRGRIVDVRGADGSPPYLVRWEPSDQERLFFPSPGVLLQPKP
jgi:hypothetical protein